MDFGNFNHLTTLSHLVSKYEISTQENKDAFFEEASFIQLIDYYTQKGMETNALNALEHALDCHRFSGSLNLRKAIFLLGKERYEKALDAIDFADVLMPNNLKITLVKAKVISHLDRTSEALCLLQDLKKEMTSSEIYLCEASIYERLEQYSEMFDALKFALAIEPSNEAALDKLWLCTEMSKRYEDSIILHDELLSENAYSSRAWYNLGHAHAYLGNYDEAIDAYEYAYLVDENFEFAYRDRAEICYELQYYKEALKSYDEALGLFEPDADLYLRVAQCHYHLSDSRTAKKYLAQAALLDSMQEEDIYFYIGKCYEAESDLNLAIGFYQKAIQIDDRREEYFIALAKAYVRQHQTILAEDAFQSATDTAPEDMNCWFEYAQFLIKEDRSEEALALLEEAAFYAIETDVLHCKVACLLLLGEREEAFRLFNDTLSEDYDSHGFFFHIMPEMKEDTVIRAILSFNR